jgi:hypothetical protein
MGFDLYGVNPKIKEGTVKPKDIDWRTATEEERDEHFKAVDEFESTNKGVYFRNNVWWWRRLADYIMEHTKCVDEKDFEKWQENGGHEVDEETAIQIANQLEHLIKTGHAEKYKQEIDAEIKKAKEHNDKVEKMLSELRLEVAKIVGEEQAEKLAPRDYPKPLNEKWWEITNQTDYKANYPFSIDNVKYFIEFARNSGGFRIC